MKYLMNRRCGDHKIGNRRVGILTHVSNQHLCQLCRRKLRFYTVPIENKKILLIKYSWDARCSGLTEMINLIEAIDLISWRACHLFHRWHVLWPGLHGCAPFPSRWLQSLGTSVWKLPCAPLKNSVICSSIFMTEHRICNVQLIRTHWCPLWPLMIWDVQNWRTSPICTKLFPRTFSWLNETLSAMNSTTLIVAKVICLSCAVFHIAPQT